MTSPGAAPLPTPGRPSWSPFSARVGLAWLSMIGVDLFFHAGVFSAVFDQSREPALLADEVLFKRIPFAYAALLVGTMSLAWIIDRTGSSGSVARRIGASSGLVVGILGYWGLWTAIDITGLLVLVAIVVLVVQGAAAATVLTSPLENRKLSIRVGLIVIGLFVLGQVAANLIG